MFDFDDITDIYDFPEEYGSFRDFDNLLRCPICKEFLHPALFLTDCQHYGCSYCMRKTIRELNICPMCRTKADETKLQKVSLVDDIIKLYKENRKVILELIEFKKNINKKITVSKECINNEDFDTTASTIFVNDDSQTVISEGDKSIQEVDNKQSNINESYSSNNEMDNLNNDSHHNDINNQINNNNNNNSNNNNRNFSSIQPSDDEFVECPLCSRSIQVKLLNRHLDLNCQDQPDSTSNNPFFKSSKSDNSWSKKIFSLPTKPKPKPKKVTHKKGSIAYYLMSENQLRKELKKLNIPSHGDKALLSKRHAEFINLYNANCDLPHPKPHHLLVEELKRWEKINFDTSSPSSKHNLFSSSRHNGSSNGVKISGSNQNSDNDHDLVDIEQEHKNYLQSHKNDFDYLINQIKQKKNKNKSKDNSETNDNEPINLDIFYDDHPHSSFDNKCKKHNNSKNIKK